MSITPQSLRLPYRWRALAAQPVPDGQLCVGDLVPLAHAVYRVVERRELPVALWSAADRDAVAAGRPAPFALQLRAVGAEPEVGDLYLGSGGAHDFEFDRYSHGHYPLCAQCREPMPCRDEMAQRIAAAAAERMTRFERAGICPACGYAVRRWQPSRSWQDNLELPGGPPVTFHLRRRCRAEALDYGRRIAAQDTPRS